MAKRQQSVEHQFEVLQTEGNSDNRAAEYHSQSQVGESHLDTAEDDPQHVHNDLQTARRVVHRFHIATEGPEREHSQTHNLHAERYSDNCQAEHQAAKQVAQRDEQATEDNPNNITDKFHCSSVLMFTGPPLREDPVTNLRKK